MPKDEINFANITKHKDDVWFLQFSENGKYIDDDFLLLYGRKCLKQQYYGH